MNDDNVRDDPEPRTNNPLKSEDAAFRVLLWVAGVAAVIIVLVLGLRALF